jgi:3-hydroxyacyl-[acyl-carrier-protein] dehydratase
MKGLYIITAGAEQGTFEATLNPDHAVFAGHFPGNPVLPGVCSMMIVRECASRMAGKQLRYAAVGECKFLSAITPELELKIRLNINYDFSLNATIHCGETVMLKLKARLTTDD